jgi:hypothetical protein
MTAPSGAHMTAGAILLRKSDSYSCFLLTFLLPTGQKSISAETSWQDAPLPDDVALP